MSEPNSQNPAISTGQTDISLPKIVRFEDLAVCGDEIWIQLKGQIYRLRRTKQDKLILTK